ncbi:MAG: hypothetical protein HY326_03475 [Chloroflexi bacterium]|nr:hypothetical protein [Chloroflexota bacterium]
MNHISIETQVTNALQAGNGILHLVPTWVPRAFMIPGRRMRLAEQDLYILGAQRGGIDERWFSSTVKADNGPGTPPDEGLSYVTGPGDERFLLAEAIETLGVHIIGEQIMADWGRWPVFCKYFDNMGPIPHHLHQRTEHARLVGREHKAEAYYFPPQFNPVSNNFPYSFFGLEPGTTKDDIYRSLERWHDGDNGILEYSKAYRLKLGTGWLIPPGILHAPGSLCTYEVQWGSDVYAIYQSMVEGRAISWNDLVKDVPEDKKHDLDFIVSLIDWEANMTSTFKQDHYLEPRAIGETTNAGYQDKWIIYGRVFGQDLFSAKELTVQPGARMVVKDSGPAGLVVIQGRGKLGSYAAEAPLYIRYGAQTWDEYFVSDETACSGYTVENTGHEPFVILRYFGPGAQEI